MRLGLGSHPSTSARDPAVVANFRSAYTAEVDCRGSVAFDACRRHEQKLEV